MENDFSFKLEKLKNNFDNLLMFSKKLDSEKELIRQKLQHFKETHQNLSKSNNKQIFIFCLDSFLFQYKMFYMEITNLDKMHTMIKNRLYCDYYKLYKMVIKYINSNFEDFKLNLQEMPIVPVYKDLEPTYDYGYTNITLVHSSLIECIKKICTLYLNKQDNINEYQSNSKVGFGISNFINTMNHESDMLQGKIDLYINYVSFFNISQMKYMKRLYNIYDEFDKQLQNIVNNEDSLSFEDLVNKPDENMLFVGEVTDNIPLTTENEEVNESVKHKEENLSHNLQKQQLNTFVELKEENVPVFTSLDDLEQKEDK